jgi:hypothetical protein
MIRRSIRRPVCGAIDCSGATSSSRFKPCDVSSKAQLKNERRNKTDDEQNHDAARQPLRRAEHRQHRARDLHHQPRTDETEPAARMTLRRFSSAKKLRGFISNPQRRSPRRDRSQISLLMKSQAPSDFVLSRDSRELTSLFVNARPEAAEVHRQFSQTAHRREARPKRDRT